MPACDTSSTKRAPSRRPPASCHVHPQTGLGELRNRGDGTGHGPKGERVGRRPRHAQSAVSASVPWCSVMLGTLAGPEAPAPVPPAGASPLTCMNRRKKGTPMAQPAPVRPKIKVRGGESNIHRARASRGSATDEAHGSWTDAFPCTTPSTTTWSGGRLPQSGVNGQVAGMHARVLEVFRIAALQGSRLEDGSG